MEGYKLYTIKYIYLIYHYQIKLKKSSQMYLKSGYNEILC